MRCLHFLCLFPIFAVTIIARPLPDALPQKNFFVDDDVDSLEETTATDVNSNPVPDPFLLAAEDNNDGELKFAASLEGH